MLSHAYWQSRFAGDPSIVGKTLTVNGHNFTIVGVAPRGFTGAKQVQVSPDIFVPLTMQPLIDPKGDKGGFIDDPDVWWVGTHTSALVNGQPNPFPTVN